MRVDQEFVPEGCSNSTGPSFTYGSGEQFYTLNDFIYKEGYCKSDEIPLQLFRKVLAG